MTSEALRLAETQRPECDCASCKVARAYLEAQRELLALREENERLRQTDFLEAAHKWQSRAEAAEAEAARLRQDAEHWKKMYECAQNANHYRQKALGE
jgi:hypothetical protein